MADIKLIWDEENQSCDISLEGINNSKEYVDVDTGDDLKTACLVYLLSDATAEDEWQYTFDKRGWCCDTDFERPIGSKIWQLSYMPVQDDNTYISTANSYVTEALSWLIDDNICKNVSVNSSLSGTFQKKLQINVSLTKADNTNIQYSYVWNI